MAYSSTSTLPTVIGQFRELSAGLPFDFRDAPENQFGMPHQVFVGAKGETRFAKVLKTVAYVVVDEDDEGREVVEKWRIKINWQRQ